MKWIRWELALARLIWADFRLMLAKRKNKQLTIFDALKK